jgi:POT family proton-dependent oligopeptide transporter
MNARALPRAVGYIISSELAERISYYGIQAILVIFMTTQMLARDGSPDPMSESEAIAYYHWFVSISMFLPLIGAFIADAFWGKYRTILVLSVAYSLGHAALAADETRVGLAIGLALIAAGAGGLKSCVPAMLGDQFKASEESRLSRVYSLYFWMLNLGSLIATLATPLLLEHFGPRVAFGVPCLLMALSTLIFWKGRKLYVRVPPAGSANLATIFSWRSLLQLRVLVVVFLLIVPPVGVLFITNSAMVLQATHLDLRWAGMTWLPSQVFVFNPLVSLALIPFFTAVAFPAIERFVSLTPLRKIGAGFCMTMAGLVCLIWLQQRIDAGAHPSVGWHVLVIAIFVAAELLIHITATEYAYRAAPVALRSVAMAFRPLTMSLGNVFVAVTTRFASPEGTHGAPGVDYYAFFLGIVAIFGVAFVWYAARLPATDSTRPALAN